MHAIDVMTPSVVSVKPDMTVQQTAALLVENGISGAPVIDANGRLVGMISESDLVRRVEIETDRPHRAWWMELLTARRDDAADYVKTHAHLVKDVMTKHVVTVQEMTPIDEVARILDKLHIRRVPVVRGNEVVGIVSRANLVQALAISPSAPNLQQILSDREIRGMLLAEIAGRKWSFPGRNVIVKNGVVHLWGYYAWAPNEVQAMRVAAEGIPGVKGVEDHTGVLHSDA
ncbi:histidine kinase [Burkholderia stabilis]|uniref:CBS domain-containing protein n=1 Tax=Burkholderia stabilis TaxID=95485 RepID=UPI0008515BFE|nr:CBS domain-containing protein [Burkholderia stabilis]AOR73201.1 histidine kinase [Burkholderia stabilis]HDR9494574.1 CBS domain-containing protein [Burkholderia stabilis]HDR9524290.1 CBS domain-containing protein [Burkholderia stabilis]HDR9541447.1 CBS domain-containing protein [Burkholderia stabilis]HDR9571263.1 CBS domain-containing protein [Burkholderia stabilis]